MLTRSGSSTFPFNPNYVTDCIGYPYSDGSLRFGLGAVTATAGMNHAFHIPHPYCWLRSKAEAIRMTSVVSVFKRWFYTKLFSNAPPSIACSPPHINVISSPGSSIFFVQKASTQTFEYSFTISSICVCSLLLSIATVIHFPLGFSTSTQLPYFHSYSSRRLSMSAYYVTLLQSVDSSHILKSAID